MIGDTSKLPKWAQDRMSTLEHKLAQEEAVRTSQGRTRISFGPFGRGLYLPDGGIRTVWFQVGDSEEDWISVGLNHRCTGLSITAAHTLDIQPQASNVVNVFNSWEVLR